MIINWENGKRKYGGDSDLFHKEIYNFVNIIIPISAENAVNSFVEGNLKSLKEQLNEMKYSSKLFKKCHLCRNLITKYRRFYHRN